MPDDLKKKQIFFILSIVIYVCIFSGGFYFSLRNLSSVKKDYIEKSIELFNLEEKQKRSNELARLLLDNDDRIEKINKALIEQTFENKQGLIFAIENIAKMFNFEYALDVSGAVTSQDVAKESAQQSRAKKRSSEISTTEVPEDKFPHVAFRTKLNGGYEEILGFVKELQSLPYYIDIKSLAISTDNRGDESLGRLNATLDFNIFTK